MDQCKLSVYSSPISARTCSALQSTKIAFLYTSESHRAVAIAEGSSVFLMKLPFLEEKLASCEGKPHRLQAGFYGVEPELLFSFSSQVPIETLSAVQQGVSNWSLLASNGIGQVYYYDCSGKALEIVDNAFKPLSYTSSILSTSNEIVTIHQGKKGTRIDDLNTGKMIRNIPNILFPTSLCNFGVDSSSFITTEYNQICIWDSRASNPCVNQLPCSSTWLYTSAIKSNLFAVGGKDRTVVVADTRKWKFQARWSNCLKYEVTSILFAETTNELLFVSGVDSEIACGRWRLNKSDEKKHNFRADSRWHGFSTLQNSDLLAGYNENGNIYLFDNASHLCSEYTGEKFDVSIGRRKGGRGNSQNQQPSKKQRKD